MIMYRLTTIDNPFDPFDQFDDWFAYDVEKGYNSCAYLARIAKTSNQLSEQENEKMVEQAIDDIIKYDILNVYMKAEREA